MGVNDRDSPRFFGAQGNEVARSLQAQHAFREALLRENPEVFDEFRVSVDPLFDEWARARPGRSWRVHSLPWSSRSRWLFASRGEVVRMLEPDHPRAGRAAPAARETRHLFSLDPILSAASAWAKKWRLDYEWIVDPAMDEVVCAWLFSGWEETTRAVGFLFGSPETTYGELEPFPGWDPRTVTRKQYRDELEGYMDRIEKACGGGSKDFRAQRNPGHSVWLVRRLIARKGWDQPEEYTDQSAVRRAVMEAATRCGIRHEDLTGFRGRKEITLPRI